MSAAVVPYQDVQQMAEAVVRGRLFPDIDTPEKAITLMLLCQAEGLHPMQALTRYHIIKGRPAMKADAMLAEFMTRGGTVHWKEWTNEACEAVFTSKGVPEGVSVRWTFEDAVRAGLTGNPSWTKFRRQMLKARVASDGVRMADPAVNQGRHTPEEVEDFEPVAVETLHRNAAPVQADAEIVASEGGEAAVASQGVAQEGGTPRRDPKAEAGVGQEHAQAAPSPHEQTDALNAMQRQIWDSHPECRKCGSIMVAHLTQEGKPYGMCMAWYDERAACVDDAGKDAVKAKYKGHDFIQLKKQPAAA